MHNYIWGFVFFSVLVAYATSSNVPQAQFHNKEPATVAAAMGQLQPHPSHHTNMLWLFFMQVVVDHNLVLTTVNGSTTCYYPPHMPEFFNDVSCFIFTHLPEHPVNLIAQPSLKAFIVYGDEHRQERLRNTTHPQYMSVSQYNLPPTAGQVGIHMQGHPSHIQFAVGDERGSESIYTTIIHTLFLRLHNHFVDTRNATFEQAKQAVIDTVHNIIFNEALTLLLGPNPCRYQHVAHLQSPHPILSAAILRIHTMVNGDIHPVNLKEAFFKPHILNNTKGDFTEFVWGLMATKTFTDDLFVHPSINKHLFHDTATPAFSLPVINLLRNLDANLPSYNHARILVKLKPVSSYEDITSNKQKLHFLKEHYPGGPNTCPIWICVRAEDASPPSLMGETATRWFSQQLCTAAGAHTPSPQHPYSFAQVLAVSGIHVDRNPFRPKHENDNKNSYSVYIILSAITALTLLIVLFGPRQKPQRRSAARLQTPFANRRK